VRGKTGSFSRSVRTMIIGSSQFQLCSVLCQANCQRQMLRQQNDTCLPFRGVDKHNVGGVSCCSNIYSRHTAYLARPLVACEARGLKGESKYTCPQDMKAYNRDSQVRYAAVRTDTLGNVFKKPSSIYLCASCLVS